VGPYNVSFNLNEISKLMLMTLCMYVWCRKRNLDKESLRLQTAYERNWKSCLIFASTTHFVSHVFHWH